MKELLKCLGGIAVAVALFGCLFKFAAANQANETNFAAAPAFLVSPDFKISGYKPDEAGDIIRNYIEVHGGELSQKGQKLKVKASLDKNTYGNGDPAYFAPGDPDTVSVTLEFGRYKVLGYSTPSDISLDGPMKPQVALYGAAVSGALDQLSKKIGYKRRKSKNDL